jgi:hypothetical protein
MIDLDGHRSVYRARGKSVGPMGWRCLGSQRRPLRTHDDGPEREKRRADCASALRGTRVDIPHDVADCSSGSPNGASAAELTPCCDPSAILVLAAHFQRSAQLPYSPYSVANPLISHGRMRSADHPNAVLRTGHLRFDSVDDFRCGHRRQGVKKLCWVGRYPISEGSSACRWTPSGGRAPV